MYFADPVPNVPPPNVVNNDHDREAIVRPDMPVVAVANDEADVQIDNQQPRLSAAPMPRLSVRRSRMEIPPPRFRNEKRVSIRPRRFSYQRLQCQGCSRYYQRCDLPIDTECAVYCSVKCLKS